MFWDEDTKCEFCEAVFPNSLELQNHLRLHSRRKPYKCDECGTKFSYNSTLEWHRRSHAGELPFKCGECDAQFSHNSVLVWHQRRHSNNQLQEQQPVQQLQEGSSAHVSREYMVQDEATPDITVVLPQPATGVNNPSNTAVSVPHTICPTMPAISSTVQHTLPSAIHQTVPSTLHHTIPSTTHQTISSSIHQTNPSTIYQSMPLSIQQTIQSTVPNLVPLSPSQPMPSTLTNPSTVPLAVSSAVLNSPMVYHTLTPYDANTAHSVVKVKKLESAYRCDICDASFGDGAHLRTHMQTKHNVGDNNPFYLLAQQANGMVRKKKIAEKTFKCDLCGAGFKTEGHRKTHRLKHTMERPFKCRKCGITFMEKVALESHERRHQADRPHKCSHCGAAFFRQSHLQKHSKRHTGQLV
ncbi:uncharacterized protein LOC143035323 [Oratosquilla oratoria]|uniref:uncharacterized protein LOC143035323 n=1 Tax=Oratosquilla oratoria TaxID=337810 RepID=UPI003F766348